MPTGKVRYDNLWAAVAKVSRGSRTRVESDRWVAFRSHYGIEAFYCLPGKEGAHEKGGVEGETGRVFHPRVNRRSQVCVRMNYHSVPTRLIGRQVRVLLGTDELVVFDGRTEVARHERLVARNQVRLELDHYLEILLRKPGALPGSTALEQARQAGKFTPVHDAWWAAVRKKHGDTKGTRALIEVLMLHRSMAHEHVVAGIATALQAGALSADVVAVEARKIAQADQPAEPAAHADRSRPVGRPGAIPDEVALLTERRLSTLPVDTRPPPSIAAYDELLRLRPPPAADAAIDQACRMLRLPTLRSQFAAIVAALANGTPEAARDLLSASTVTQPWGDHVAACLQVLCSDPNRPARPRATTAMIHQFQTSRPITGYAVFRAHRVPRGVRRSVRPVSRLGSTWSCCEG